MSNAGQAVLTVGGAIVGAVFGNPQLGYLIGSAAGQALFPTDLGTVKGPRLNDTAVQSSAIGAPIFWVFGTYAVAGNVIWSSGIVESVSRQRQGGKGGPTQTNETYSYSANVAVGICRGPMAGIQRVWADAKLIYDARPQQPDETDEQYDVRSVMNVEFLEGTVFYLGTDDQLVDPTIESFEGVGNVSAFRELCYAVHTEFQLADYGNRVPNFRYEVVSLGTLSCEIVGAYEPPYMPPYNTNFADPRGEGGAYQYNSGYSSLLSAAGTDGSWTSFGNACSIRAGALGRAVNAAIISSAVWSGSDFDYVGDHYGFCGSAGDILTSRFLVGFVNGVSAASVEICWDETLPITGTELFALAGFNKAYLQNVNPVFSATPSGGSIIQLVPYPSSPYTIDGVECDEVAVGSWDIGGTLYTVGYIHDDTIVMEQLGAPPPPPCFFGTPGPIPGYCYRNGVLIPEDVLWTETSGNFRCLQRATRTGTYPNLSGSAFVGPALPEDHPLYDDEAWWTDQYDLAVAEGRISSGRTFNSGTNNLSHFPHTTSGTYYATEYPVCTLEGLAVPLAFPVSEISKEVGLAESQFSVSDLGELVPGYCVSRLMSGRDAIEPLRGYGYFDAVESGGLVKFPTRGKPVVLELTSDQMGAHLSGSDRPTAIETSRRQEVELPRRLRVHYARAEQNYEPGEQAASRLSTRALQEIDLEFAISMTDAKAAQIAEVHLYTAWVERNGYTLPLDQEFLALDPADAIGCPVDGIQERLRITGITYQLPSLLRLDAVKDDDGTYVSFAVGTPAGQPSSGPSAAGTAQAIYLDLPLLRDADNDPGYYAAVYRNGGTVYSGAAIFRSPDGGATYQNLVSAPLEATVGEVVGALPSGPTGIVDEGNELVVALETGVLESISDASLLAGLNAAAIGADNRWEVLQFRTATLIGDEWHLTGLLRGRRGTEWAVGTSVDADRFVLLNPAVVRVPLNVAGIGANREHKVVAVGSSLDTTTETLFTGEGVALEPFSPVSVEGSRAGDELTITWIRRGRIGSELPSGSDIPLSEESESYEVDVLDGSDVVRTLASATPSVVYSAANQTTDFGSPQASVTVRVYQLSATVGRGYPAEATI